MSRLLIVLGLIADLGSLIFGCLGELTCLTASAFFGGILFAAALAARLFEPLVVSLHELPEVLSISLDGKDDTSSL